MATKELSAYISQRIRQLGVTKTQVIKRSKLSRQAFYNILNDKILEETKLSISHDYLSDDRWMMMRSGLAVLKGLPVLSSQSNSLTTNMVKVF